MRKFFGFLFVFVAGLILITGCKKDDEVNQPEVDEQIIKDYLADHNLNATRDDSGLYYIITEEGTGEHPTATSKVSVFYKGYLTNGNVFDETTNGSESFYLSNLIEGWQIGIPILKEGGSGTFFVPSALGYGSQSTGSIPANSVLIFEISLVNVF